MTTVQTSVLGRSTRTFNRPPGKPPSDGVRGQSESICPILHHQAFASKLNPPDELATVSSLVLTRGPAAVVGRVRPIVIFALQCQIWRRTRPHVGDEILEAVTPAVAHRDPAPTVVFIEFMLRREAPSLHVHPDAILRHGAPAVRPGLGSCHLACETATASSLTLIEASSDHLACLATITLAVPQDITLLSSSAAQGVYSSSV